MTRFRLPGSDLATGVWKEPQPVSLLQWGRGHEVGICDIFINFCEAAIA